MAPSTPIDIAQASGLKNTLVINKGRNPPTVVTEVVIMCLVERITTSISLSLLSLRSSFASLMCERTTIASLMDKPIKPTAPTKPINPKFVLPTKSPKNASPVHKIATLKIIPASLKELSAEINAITIKTKKIVAEEKAEPETLILIQLLQID